MHMPVVRPCPLACPRQFPLIVHPIVTNACCDMHLPLPPLCPPSRRSGYCTSVRAPPYPPAAVARVREQVHVCRPSRMSVYTRAHRIPLDLEHWTMEVDANRVLKIAIDHNQIYPWGTATTPEFVLLITLCNSVSGSSCYFAGNLQSLRARYLTNSHTHCRKCHPPLSGGSVKVVDSTTSVVLTTIVTAGVVEPGAMTELQWHPTQDEWDFNLYSRLVTTASTTHRRCVPTRFETPRVACFDVSRGRACPPWSVGRSDDVAQQGETSCWTRTELMM
ncbi:hypothetical protein HD554DRAFT_1077943 [Boletus coccyginus]|nr:hypothetical protein HD554DRAFT_1077943 [Boletus coccyginus]